MKTVGFTPIKLTDFRGAQPDLAFAEITNTRAAYARNIISKERGLSPRNGYALFETIAGSITFLYNWIAHSVNAPGLSPDRLVIMNAANQLQVFYARTGILVNIATIAGTPKAPVVCEQGLRLYVTGVGFGGVRVMDPNEAEIDFAFAPPFAATIAVTDTGVGTVGIGKHRFAFIGESRSGFLGKLSPVSGPAFAPFEYTVTSTDPLVGRKLTVTVSGAAPAEIAKIHLVMTTVENLDQYYFVPNGSLAVGTVMSATVEVDIADDRLTQLSQATDYDNWITRGVGSNADPINCYAVLEFKSRMVYICGPDVYVSEPDNFQQISGDQHVLRVRGAASVTAGVGIGNSLYLFTESSTSVYQHRDDVPVTWAKPDTVGGAQGVPSQNCVAVTIANDSGSSYAVTANPDGLWYFDGNYSLKPINYFQLSVWKTINWAAADKIRIVDHTSTQSIYVLAPLGSSTVANRLMVFSYGRGGKNLYGITPEQIDYYEHDLGDFATLSALCMFKDPETRQTSPMVAMPVGGNTKLMQQRIERNTLDDTAGFIAEWRSASLLNRLNQAIGAWHRFGGFSASISGKGEMRVVMTATGSEDSEIPDSGDGTMREQVPIELSLAPDPKANVEQGFLLESANATLAFRMDTAGGGDFYVKWAKVLYRVISRTLSRVL